MKRNCLLSIVIVTLIVIATGCTWHKPATWRKPARQVEQFVPNDINVNDQANSGKFIQKVDNLIIVLDASSSMALPYRGTVNSGLPKITVAKDILMRMNSTMPDMNIKVAMVTFGNKTLSLPPFKKTKTIYTLTDYTRDGLNEAIDSVVRTGGNSPAGLALEDTHSILGTVSGQNAVILLSDGEKLSHNPVTEVENIKSAFGQNTCLYTIWVGNKSEGRDFLNTLARRMRCGDYVSADDIASSDDMADFVKKVFFTTDRAGYSPHVVNQGRGRFDNSGYGILDQLDQLEREDNENDNIIEPAQQEYIPPVKIQQQMTNNRQPVVKQQIKSNILVDPSKQLGLDTDGDGVTDDKDQCPDTPLGASVDFRGCWVIKGVNFAYKKYDIKPTYNSELDNVVNILKRIPDLNIRVEGHTDNIGSMDYNTVLSRDRALAVKNYLIRKGIDGWRITTEGFSFTYPIASNDTPEGRALNRRAEIIPVK